MSLNHGPFTYEQIIRFIGEQSEPEEGTEGLKIMDSTPAKLVMGAYFHEFDAICSYSPESPVEKQLRMDDLFKSTLSGDEHMCAYILMNNLWQDHVP